MWARPWLPSKPSSAPRRHEAWPGASQSGSVSSPLLPGASSLAAALRASSRRAVPAGRLLAVRPLQEGAVPADHPHTAADPGALVQVFPGPGREVGPVAVVRAHRGRADGHRGDVGAERQQHGAVLGQAAAQGLDGLVIGRGVHRQSRGNARGLGRCGGHRAQPGAWWDEIEEQVTRHAGRGVGGGIARPGRRVVVDGPGVRLFWREFAGPAYR